MYLTSFSTTYGWGRWEKIKESAKLSRWGLYEIESFAKAYLCKCLKFCEARDAASIVSITGVDILARGYEPGNTITSEWLDFEASEKVPEYLDAPVNPDSSGSIRRFDSEPCLTTAQFNEYLERNAVKIVNRLLLASQLLRAFRSSANPFDDITVPDSPGPWWGRVEDRDLLIGCG